MSRMEKSFVKPHEILGVTVDKVAWGKDHATGYFVSGYKKGKFVLDRDTGGFSMVECPNSNKPLSREEWERAVENIARIEGEQKTIG